jgi:hypothetical protein
MTESPAERTSEQAGFANENLLESVTIFLPELSVCITANLRIFGPNKAVVLSGISTCGGFKSVNMICAIRKPGKRQIGVFPTFVNSRVITPAVH